MLYSSQYKLTYRESQNSISNDKLHQNKEQLLNKFSNKITYMRDQNDAASLLFQRFSSIKMKNEVKKQKATTNAQQSIIISIDKLKVVQNKQKATIQMKIMDFIKTEKDFSLGNKVQIPKTLKFMGIIIQIKIKIECKQFNKCQF